MVPHIFEHQTGEFFAIFMCYNIIIDSFDCWLQVWFLPALTIKLSQRCLSLPQKNGCASVLTTAICSVPNINGAVKIKAETLKPSESAAVCKGCHGLRLRFVCVYELDSFIINQSILSVLLTLTTPLISRDN